MTEWILRICAAIALVTSVAGCGDGTLDTVDPAAAPAAPTWSAHISPIVTRRCGGCHASDATGGPVEDVAYDDCQSVVDGWPGVVEFGLDAPHPGGADPMPSAEKLTLERWWTQGANCE